MSDITRTILLDDGDEKLELRKYSIRVNSGANAGLTQVGAGRRLEIGSSPENGLCLDDPLVSRFHAEIEVGPRGYLLRDRESKNGTWVHGLQVGSVFLEDGTVFKLGDTECEFKLENEAVEVRFSGKNKFGKMLGKSLAMREIFALLERVAPTDATVLIEGESGTGKELVAEGIHASSPRAKGPFIVVDCSAIARDIIESELFGHVKGAFTGASGSRKGAFEAANGGTLFLDELGELPIDLQPKLLRALEKREVKPVGGNETLKTNVRIVAATNRNLLQEVKDGNFREDLYYRLSVLPMHVPPLRERPDDIPVIAEHLTQEQNRLNKTHLQGFSKTALSAMKAYNWPGNVRELQNLMQRLSILKRVGQIELEDLPAQFHGDNPPPPQLGLYVPSEGMDMADTLERLETSLVKQALQKADGNKAAAARLLGLNRTTLVEKVKRLRIQQD
jgi:DNA-binding NtrC family response regulator